MTAPERIRILVVEDQSDAQTLLRYHLSDTFHVEIAPNVDEALRVITEQSFDLFILDINLGEKRTGIDLLNLLRKTSDHGDVPAIALTAYALPGDRERFLRAGFNAYLSKPFSREALIAAIHRIYPPPSA